MMGSKFLTVYSYLTTGLILGGIGFLSWHRDTPRDFEYYNGQYQKAVFKTKTALARNNKVISFKMDRLYDQYNGDSLVRFVKNNKYGYLNLRTGKAAIKPAFDQAWNFDGESGLAAAAEQGILGFIDRHGQWIIPPSYSFIFEELVEDEEFIFSNGTCIIPNHDKRGLINARNELLLDAIYDEISERILNQYRIVMSGELYGLYSEKTRSFKIPMQPDELYDGGSGIVMVETGPFLSQYLLDENMNRKQLIFDSIEQIKAIIPDDSEDDEYYGEPVVTPLSGFSKYSINDRYGIMDDLTGKIVCPPLFDDIVYFSKGIFKVTTGDFEYLINSRGEAINR